MNQKNKFEKVFTPDLKKETDAIVERYETRRASILEVLRFLMDHYGHITLEMEEAVAGYLEIPPIDVREVMTFYTLFYQKPRAKTRLHVCRTLACSLLGANELIRHLEEKLKIKAGEMTPEGEFSLEAVECLGACEIAPMMQLNDNEYIGHLTKEKLNEICGGETKKTAKAKS